MIRFWLNEDKLPPKLDVRFSYEINKQIKNITAFNKNRPEKLQLWADYIEGMKMYMSDSTIAWDNMGRYPKLKNGGRFVADLEYNIGYTILEDYWSRKPFVYIFMANLNLEGFELKSPIKCNTLSTKRLDAIIIETINRYLRNNILLAY